MISKIQKWIFSLKSQSTFSRLQNFFYYEQENKNIANKTKVWNSMLGSNPPCPFMLSGNKMVSNKFISSYIINAQAS